MKLLQSIGEWLVANYACRKCNEMHRRTQAAESELARCRKELVRVRKVTEAS